MAQGMHLSQRMALQQVLAPQLQQSLALLQAPILELKALVEQEMQQNPMLEEQPAMEAGQEERRDGEDLGPSEAADPSEPPADVKFDPATESAGTPPDDFQAEFDHLAQVDQEWRDQFSQANAPMRSREEDEEKRQFMFDSLVAGTSLQEHLLEQVRLSELTEEQRPIAEMVVGNIDDRGYLQSGVDELAFATNHPPEQVREVLAVVKMFNPPGVGARDLRECLLLQLERAGRQDSLEYSIIREHMDALGRRRFPEIARTLGKTIEEVQTAVDRISQLDPRPGGEFDRDDNQYVVPEVFVQKVGDPRWTLVTGDIRDLGSITHRLMRSDGSDPTLDFVRRQISPQLLAALSDGGSREAQKGIKADLVADLNRLIVGEGFPRDLLMKLRDLSDEPKQLLGRKLPAGVNGRLSRRILEDLFPNAIVRSPGTEFTVTTNNESVPHLRISNTYKDLMGRSDSPDELREYIRDKIRAGKFLIKSIQQRQQTLLNIGKEIVSRQQLFMELGVAYLMPMTMAQVAQVVGVHETTVSRAVSGKYIQTPQGFFEMKYFFTSGLPTSNGSGVSNESVKQIISELIAAEDRTRPLSDEEIVKRLSERGVMIARRTVAKYRMELNILPSHLRRDY